MMRATSLLLVVLLSACASRVEGFTVGPTPDGGLDGEPTGDGDTAPDTIPPPDPTPSCALAIVDPGDSTQPSEPSFCLCTRRDPVPAGSCARGDGTSASAEIGPAGGKIELPGQQGAASGVPFSITFPPGAVATPTLITVIETKIPPPDGMVDWSPVYYVGPVDLVLAEPASLMMPFSQGRGSSIADDKLSIFWSGTSVCSLERLPSSYTNAGFMQGRVGRLGYAVVGYANAGAAVACE